MTDQLSTPLLNQKNRPLDSIHPLVKEMKDISKESGKLDVVNPSVKTLVNKKVNHVHKLER